MTIGFWNSSRSSPEFKCYLCHTFGADAAKWLKIPRNSLVNLILCLICLLVSETQPSLKPAPRQLQSWRWNDRNTPQLASHWSLSTFLGWVPVPNPLHKQKVCLELQFDSKMDARSNSASTLRETQNGRETLLWSLDLSMSLRSSGTM